MQTMNVLPLPTVGCWAGDLRGDGRAVRVSAHPDARLVTLTWWKDERCMASAHLRPDEVAGLVGGLTECLVQLAARPPGVPTELDS